MRKRKFIFGAGMLATLGIVAKLIGVFYRLPLTNILGAEGMGLYQMIFPVYSLLIAFIAGGIPSAVARCVSELSACGREKEGAKALKLGMVVPVALGIAVAAVLVIFRREIALLQGNEAASVAYIAIAPAVVVYGVIASVRGYFQGLNNLLPSGISQLIEQAAKVVFGLALAASFGSLGADFAVFGALIGVSISEAAAAFYLCIKFVKKGRRLRASLEFEAGEDVAIKPYTSGELMRKIYSVALPVTLGSLVMPLSQAVDSFLVINILSRKIEVSGATSLYGIFTGPVSSLINLPVVVTSALAAALLPEIAALKSRNLDTSRALSEKISGMFILIVPVFAVFFIAPRPILSLLYFRGLSEAELSVAATLLRLESIDVLLLGVIQLVTSFQQGMCRAFVPVLCLAVGAVMKVASVIALLPLIGIAGAAFSTVIGYAITCALDVICLKRSNGRLIDGKKGLKVLLCVTVFALCMALYLPLSAFIGEIAALFVCVFIASGAYLLVIIKTKCILLNEILS